MYPFHSRQPPLSLHNSTKNLKQFLCYSQPCKSVFKPGTIYNAIPPMISICSNFSAKNDLSKSNCAPQDLLEDMSGKTESTKTDSKKTKCMMVMKSESKKTETKKTEPKKTEPEKTKSKSIIKTELIKSILGWPSTLFQPKILYIDSTYLQVTLDLFPYPASTSKQPV